MLIAVCAAADDVDTRLRIAWGGGEPRPWQGLIRVNAGSILEVTPLGLKADEPGSMLVSDATTVRISPRTPRDYDVCDVHIRAPADAKLSVQLWVGDGPAGGPLEMALPRLIRDVVQFDLDERKNRLLVQRSPGDALRVSFDRGHLVFSPGETFDVSVETNALELVSGASYLLAAALCPARGEQQLWNEDREVRVEAGGAAPISKLRIPLPMGEGVYDLRLSLFPKRLTTSFIRTNPIATRKVQLVVVSPVKTVDEQNATWQSILEFDPANPKWYERLTRLPTWPRLPNLPQHPVTSGPAATRTHLGKSWVELSPGAWQAYPLAVSSVGMPHIVEVEYPSDIAQTLGISLIEPGATGKIEPIGVDSGVDVSALPAAGQGEIRRHRLTIWPRTRAPYLLVVNRRDNAPAIVGKVKVLAGPAELPPLKIAQPAQGGRKLAAYYHQPLFAENFSATEFAASPTAPAFKDWVTFYDGARRMIQALQQQGYNALVLTVACKGSAIYPSRLLAPTPEYDTGVFFESDQDPIRKDVLELLLRLCDRSGIEVTCAVQFATPLPALEAIRQSAGGAAGLEPLGPDGRTWMERNGPQNGTGVYYNALDERVQQAMVEVVSELAERYGQHASFGGVAVQLSTEGYSLLPDETCSYDDVTVARFMKDTKTELPAMAGDAPAGERLAARAKFFHDAGEKAWIEWRCGRLTGLYKRMSDEVARRRDGAKLYLTTTDILANPQLRLAFRPMLPPREDLTGLFPLLGFDVQRLTEAGIVVPRPQRIVQAQAMARRDLDRYWNVNSGLTDLFAPEGHGSAMHFLEPEPLRLPEFDAASPFGADKTRTLLISQIVPADATQRERFVQSLADLDASLVIDGGWMLPLGQETGLTQLVKVYRKLPSATFETGTSSKTAVRGRDLILRTHVKNGKTYFYALNPAPWPVKAEITFQAVGPVRLISYADERQADLHEQDGRAVWSVQMEAFDLVGGEVAGGDVKVVNWEATPPEQATEAMREQIRDALRRANALRFIAPLTVPGNASFEAPARERPIPGWITARGRGIVAEVDRTAGFKSPSSLHIASRTEMGGAAPNVWVRSDSFDAPTTGRLSVMAWIRVADASKQPKLRMAIEGKLDGHTYYRRANVGASEREGAAVKPLTTEWASYRFPLNDLPASGLTDLRVGFDLMSEGEVWIDDVQVYDLWFEERERDELVKSIATVQKQLSDGQVSASRLGECQAFADSYWPRFLRQHVSLSDPRMPSAEGELPSAPAAENQISSRSRPAPAEEKAHTKPASSWDKMREWMPSWPKWR
jgi:hypothetical protein